MPNTKAEDLKPPEPYQYNLGELICFYSQLSEPTEAETIAKLWNPDSPGQGNYLYRCVRTKSDNELVALMRGWADGTRGIVYDIAVRRDYRGAGAGKSLREDAKALIAQAAASNPNALFPHGNPFRVASNLDRGLANVRTLYAISFILGFQKVGEGLYFLLFQDHSHLTVRGHVAVLLVLLTSVLVLLGFRFFWAVGNIRRMVLRRISTLQPPPRRWLLIHFGLLFSAPLLFFFLCRLFQDLCGSLCLGCFSFRFVETYIILLVLNSAWLALLTWEPKADTPGEKNMSKRVRLGKDLFRHVLGLLKAPFAKRGTEQLWVCNNFYTAMLALLTLVVAKAGHLRPATVAYVACVLFIVNSGIDLLNAPEVYVLGDAFEGG